MASSRSIPKSRPGPAPERASSTRAAMPRARRLRCCGLSVAIRMLLCGASKMTSDPHKKTPDKKANRRGAARLAAVQALYQMDIAGAGINDIFAEFESHWLGGEVEGDKYLPAEAAFFKTWWPAWCATRPSSIP